MNLYKGCYTFNIESCSAKKIYQGWRQKLTKNASTTEIIDQEGLGSATPWRRKHEHQRWERPNPESAKKESYNNGERGEPISVKNSKYPVEANAQKKFEEHEDQNNGKEKMKDNSPAPWRNNRGEELKGHLGK